jgi:hypothetical protein
MSENETAPAEGTSEFTPITSQEALDKIMGSRIDGVKRKYSDYDGLKAKAHEYDAIVEKGKTDQERQQETIRSLTSALDEERAGRLRADVAALKGVPASSLTGSTTEELEASADALIEWRGEVKKPVSRTGLKSGATGSDQMMDPKEAAAIALRQLRHL